MADKQITHPGGLLPSWANDLNMNDPSEPWDGTPTKVEPGAGKRDDGYLPEENPTAQHLNHKFNELARWVQYFSSMQAMNWLDGGAPSDASVAQANSGHSLCYDEGTDAWFVFGDIVSVAIEAAFSRDGQTWQELTGFAASTTPPTWAASKPPDDTPTHTGVNVVVSCSSPSAAQVVHEILTGGVTQFTAGGTGTSAINQHVWNAFQERWIFVGGTNLSVTPQPAIWTQVSPIGGALTPRTATPLNSTECELVAGSSAGLIVVVGNAAPFDVWTSTNGFTFTRATPTGITGGQSARALIWDELRQVFVLLTAKSTYTSINGVAWSLVSTLVAGNFQTRCFDYDGGALYIAASDFGAPVAIRFSRDGGVSWRLVPVPPSEGVGGGGTTDPITKLAYSRGHGRFMAIWGDQASGDDGNVALGLAVGETVFEVDAISIPTVT
jgi:hypothetical protein